MPMSTYTTAYLSFSFIPKLRKKRSSDSFEPAASAEAGNKNAAALAAWNCTYFILRFQF